MSLIQLSVQSSLKMNETNRRDGDGDSNAVSPSSKRSTGTMDMVSRHTRSKKSKKLREYTDELLEILESKELHDWEENHHLFLAAFKRFSLRLASSEVKNHKELVSLAVTCRGWDLEHASAALQNDRDVVTLAVKTDGMALEFASDDFKTDREIVTLAVTEDGMALRDASEELQNDKEIVLLAVSNNGNALVFAAGELQNDRDVVMAAITADENYGLSLCCVSEEFQNDSEIVSLAVTEDGKALEWASLRLRSDKQIAMLALEKCDEAFEYVEEVLWNDPEIIAAAASYIVSRGMYAEDYLGPELRRRLLHINKALENEKEFPCLEDVVKDDGTWGKFADQKWKRSVYETIWLLNKSYDKGLPYDVKKSIVEYSGLDANIRLANELSSLAFLYRNFAEAGWHWNDITCYDSEVSDND